jgi:hypothetical protein
MKAIAKVPNDPSKGYYNAESICWQPITTRMSDGVKGCPNCDKEPPVGNVHPRTTNSAGVALTAKELRECGVTEDGSLIPSATITAALPVEGNIMELKKDTVNLEIQLEEIETSSDVVRLLVQRVVDNMDSLPTPTLKESKRLIKLQEKLQKLLEA